MVRIKAAINIMKQRVSHKISVKIGLSFLLMAIAIEMGIFISLFLLVVNTWINEQASSLVKRGENHAHVLTNDFTAQTIKHVVLTEKGDTDMAIIVQSPDGQTLMASQVVNSKMKKHLAKFTSASQGKSEVLHSDWIKKSYLVSKSPIIKKGKLLGNVYMFLSTKQIQKMVFDFSSVFIVLVILTFLITIFATASIAKNLTLPIRAITSETKKERNEFFAAVTHELRTPLTFIKGYTDIASRESVSEGERVKYLSIIRDESARLTHLMDDMMTLVQFEAHNFSIKKSSVLIANLMDDLMKKVAGILNQKNIHLNIIGSQQFEAKLDYARMQQVLINLVINAYKYSPDNSTISIDIEQSPKSFSIQISDEGEGIDAADLPYIFEHFYRVDKSRTRKTGGVGLGLTIVQDIIKLHDGNISVKSKQHGGTTFTIELPYD
jgi:signal transduction histidine kinase